MATRIHKISKYKPSVLQGRLDFSPVAALSFSREHSLEGKALRGSLCILVALSCAYLYFVSASVLNVMDRREALAQIDDVQGRIGGLEQEYFELSQSVTPHLGTSLGLSPVKETAYVYRPGTIGTATIAHNEI